jgi:hypothetical protein
VDVFVDSSLWRPFQPVGCEMPLRR